MHRNRNRIVAEEKSQPISQKESLCTVWPRKRIASLNRKSSPGDGALRALVGDRQFGRHLKRQFGRGWLRVKNCRETAGSQLLPRGIKMSRRPLWMRKRLSQCPSQALWAMFRKPQPLPVSEKVRQYTSNLYGSTSPICTAMLSWLLSFEERETLQYASHLYGSTPPICTAVRPPICTAVLLEKYWGLGSPERFWLCDVSVLSSLCSILPSGFLPCNELWSGSSDLHARRHWCSSSWRADVALT